MSMMWLDEESSDEPEGNLAHTSGEESTVPMMKRKRTVSKSQISASTLSSRTENIVLQGCNSRTESEQKAEGIV